MIIGAHFLLYSEDPAADRAFFRDILGFRSVDAGEGWLIFARPPAELGVHPGDAKFVQPHGDQRLLGAALYLMCDDLSSFVRLFKTNDIDCSPFAEAEWGIVTTIRLPSGGRLGLYQPKHPTAF
jgi:catechol 2,3-dioxygenase-like lactoylglutathione lyase family enzyme